MKVSKQEILNWLQWRCPKEKAIYGTVFDLYHMFTRQHDLPEYDFFKQVVVEWQYQWVASE